MPQIEYKMPILGGQREIAVGPKLYEFTLLGGYYERDYAATTIPPGPDTAGGYVDSMAPGGIVTKSLGSLDWSTKEDKLIDQNCIVITSTGRWNQSVGKKPNEVRWTNEAKQQYWLTPDGKIIRQYFQLTTPQGTQSADLTYGTDSIQRRYTNLQGKTSFGEIFPVCGMDALHEQFRPMLAHGKVLARDKEFYRCNPLTGGLEKCEAHISGKFQGKYLGAGFRGTTVDIVGPAKDKQTAFVSDDDDLVQVKIDQDRFFVINVVPKSRLDEFHRPIPTIPPPSGG
jgi:hypothetical protein